MIDPFKRTGYVSNMTDSKISVAIVEDDPEIRNLLTLVIDGSPGYRCTQAYSNAEEAYEAIVKNPPDVVLMDINLPGSPGIECVRKLRETLPDLDCLMLTIQDDDTSVFESLCAGATGYLLKDTPPAALLQAISEVASGGAPMSAAIARRVLASFRSADESNLSQRENEVLKLLCDGANYKNIADDLHISGHTVRTHIKNIYRKLHVTSRAEAVKKAIRDRLI